MLSESEMKKLTEKTFEFAVGYDTEVMVNSGDGALTRFSDNIITQNVSSHGDGLTVRLIKDGKMGKASTGNLADDGIKRCVDTAKAALKVAEKDDEIFPLPGAQEYQPIANYNSATPATTPDLRANGVIKAIELFKKDNLNGAGIFSSGGGGLGIATSNGLWAYNRSSNAKFSISAMSKDSSGWSEDFDSDISKLNIDKIAATAAQKAIAGKNPGEIEPGAYTVIFEPYGVAEFLMFLSWEAFNGLSFAEGRSPFSGKIGKKVVGDNITLVDDAYHELTLGQPFDYEGFPRKRVSLIENGVFMGTAHNRKTAKMTGLEQTGHSFPQPDSTGPMPGNMILEGGNSSLEEMIASTEKGLLVTKLHYVNILNPMTVMLTGMTRDGLFLIENGKVTRGLKNMRFTESVLNVLSNVESMSKQLYRVGTFWGGGGSVAPAIKVNNFHFTSKTEN